MRLYLLCITLGLIGSAGATWLEGFHGHAVLLALGAGAVGYAGLQLLKLSPVSEYGPNAKPSACCPGELLVPMHSTNTKLCTGCKTEQPWPLEPGQKRTFE